MSKRVRRSLQEVYANYLDGKDRVTLQKVVRSFQGIQELPAQDPNSFYSLGGWHGEPFRGPGATKDASSWWWGGYCNHGNVLFPTWHRAYLLRLEEAMRSIDGCQDVSLPFWDECFDMNSNVDPKHPKVIPEILTKPTFEYDPDFPYSGKDRKINNPLYSYTLARDTSYQEPNEFDKEPNTRYSKPKGYQTVRFPKSGLVSTKEIEAVSAKYNEQFSDPDKAANILNGNVLNWLEGTLVQNPNPDPSKPPPRLPDTTSVYTKFKKCLYAPNYTVFSNTTSAAAWIADYLTDAQERDTIVPLEAPHNNMHLAVGGFYQEGVYNANPADYQNAQGDMGDNETASFDPIFFFHHCFIDYVFWTYQKRHNLTEKGSLEVIYDFPGTITDANGSPVGLPPGSVLDMDTPLIPFRPHPQKPYFTSHDVTNIDALGYTYGVGSLDHYVDAPKGALLAQPDGVDPTINTWLRVQGINRAAIEGSFVVRTYAIGPDGTKVEIGREAVLSRLNVRGCKNCQTHLEAHSFSPLYQGVLDFLRGQQGKEEDVKLQVIVQTHDGYSEQVPSGPSDSRGMVHVKPRIIRF